MRYVDLKAGCKTLSRQHRKAERCSTRCDGDRSVLILSQLISSLWCFQSRLSVCSQRSPCDRTHEIPLALAPPHTAPAPPPGHLRTPNLFTWVPLLIDKRVIRLRLKGLLVAIWRRVKHAPKVDKLGLIIFTKKDFTHCSLWDGRFFNICRFLANILQYKIINWPCLAFTWKSSIYRTKFCYFKIDDGKQMWWENYCDNDVQENISLVDF